MAYTKEPIAVVGSGCRFPGGSTSASKLWQLLSQPRDVLSKIDRFRADNFHNNDGHHHGANNVLHSYLLQQDTRAFDAQFFNISVSEAEAIDPQQRLLMETVYESLEAAGLSIDSLSDSNTACYVGVMCDDFSGIVYADSEQIPTYAATGSSRSIMSNRVSYFFNWHGPSMTIDTACSSSLVAVHQAVQVLRSGECPVAVAAGTNLIFSPTMYIAESNLNMLSPTGRSRMWDAGADGYARGEGVGALVLKTLSAALRDGDHIECLIRETGVNQDGRTPGITMPSSIAQAALIRDTYARAGLDPTKREERCQYFEAHGTGTKAGDPQEAGAIYRAFFSHKEGEEKPDEAEDNADEDVLYVGSIKTVIGHTEGTAGIAGLMKASLAVQNKLIPSNMHFTKLNPDLEPYYGHLKVPVDAVEWPELPAGVPRRASVNSFGFGGTNAHAIIEAYEPPTAMAAAASDEPSLVATPFLFSATSERSLRAQLDTLIQFLRASPDFNLQDLSWSLSRRTAFKFRSAFAGLDAESLIAAIEAKMEESMSKNEPLAVRSSSKSNDVLGIFTGQGAQWASMGRHLVQSSKLGEDLIARLEKSLAGLPDGPEWSLKAEIMADKETSRIAEGELSQPICTAIQILLVDILGAAGIKFMTVVGHSSGEIAAAYTAGFLNATDAIRIAYYRGKYTKLAKGPNGKSGGMLAAGTDMADAADLVSLPKLKGRVQVAASNSSASVTISGDEDAVDFVQLIFEDESKFARKLKVDTAYHSAHMVPCSPYYLEALGACGIEIQTPGPEAARWYSSVLDGELITMKHAEKLCNSYWRDNMLQPVLFSQALTAALKVNGTPGVVLEVGPHPALKGPASLTIEEISGSAIPYFGTLSRGSNDINAMATALGSIWTIFGSGAVDFKGYARAFNAEAQFQISKEIPGYTWDHEKVIWNETRLSKAHRLREHKPHELLGARTTDEAEGEYRWRNYIKPSEMPWLRGHAIQGQTVFPAAGFAVMALEAAKVLAPAEKMRLMELLNFSIHRALSFYDDHTGVETIFAMSNVQKQVEVGQSYLTADFSCHACMNKDTGGFSSMASGQLRIQLAEQSLEALPGRPSQTGTILDVDVDYFYSALAKLGYGYTGMFQGITELRRKTGGAHGEMTIPIDAESVDQHFVVHPATLDVAFQSIFAAIGAPGDGRLWTLHVPTLISRITVNPAATQANSGVEVPLPFDAALARSENGISGDVDIYAEDGKNAIILVEGLHVTPLTQPTEADDRQTFAETVWDKAEPDGALGWREWTLTEEEYEGAALVERMCFYYLRKLHEVITKEERESCDWHQRCVLDWAAYVVGLAANGQHITCKREWLNDDWSDDIKERFDYWSALHPHFHTLVFIGERLIPFVRGELSLLEEFKTNNMLEEFYFGHYGYNEYNMYLGKIVQQLAHRHHNMRILEIGAGTGSSTAATLQCLGENFASYTYTDVSAAFFVDAQDKFAKHSEKMVFKPLDIEKDPKEQGFEEGAYDLVIAGNVLHATSVLEETMKNVRKLLRPGGHLALLEITNNNPLRIAFGFCGLPGWWAGRDDGRKFSPLIPKSSWSEVMRKTGFSGIDTATPDERLYIVPFSVMLTQAVDTQMNMIRNPLDFEPESPNFSDNLLLLGGRKPQTKRLVRTLAALLQPYYHEILRVPDILDIDDDIIAEQPTVLSLLELDEHIFDPFTEEKFKAIVRLCDHSKNMLWVTTGSRGEDPYMNMMVGTGRCLVGEMTSLRLQFLNFDGGEHPSPELISEHLLRLQISDAWAQRKPKPYTPLWTLEREMTIEDGRLLIPRYLPATDVNARLNSERRPITKSVKPETTVLEIHSSDSGYHLLEVTGSDVEGEKIEVNVSKSLLSAVSVAGVGCLYLVAGVNLKSNKRVLALTEACRSVVSVSKNAAVDINTFSGDEEALLYHCVNHMLADSILTASGAGTSILVHEPTPTLLQLLREKASGKQVTFTTAFPGYAGAKYIHPSAPDRFIFPALTQGVSLFVDLSESIDARTVGSRIRNHLGLASKVLAGADLVTPKAYTTAEFTGDAVSKVFAKVVNDALSTVSPGNACALSLSTVQGLAPQHQDLHIVDWKAESEVAARIVPAEELIKFRSDKTYFMIGLTGEVGLALARWMVHRGARHLALASRNPKVDAAWLEQVEAQGASIRLYAMDITSRDSVRATHAKICAEMPPIGGVANGAMILIDGLFANKTYEDFVTTLKPKVDGTLFLDELFSSPTDDLDFFMVFSSLASVSGNIGQTSYAAANAFMCSLVGGRRKRGLVGSAINMPGIVGLGYLNRDPSKLERLRSVGYANINEWEFYQFFAEAVMAGKPDSGRNPEITAGLERIDVERNENPPAWVNIPRFAWLRLVKPQEQNQGGRGGNTVSVRSKLKEMKSEEEVYQLLLDGLLTTLYTRLSMNPDERGITPETTIVELGVDSLLAVDMRSWFTKELDLDMPVLKILGGATVADLVEDAVKRLSSELIPNVVASTTENAEKPSEETATTNTPETAPKAQGEETVGTTSPEAVSKTEGEEKAAEAPKPASNDGATFAPALASTAAVEVAAETAAEPVLDYFSTKNFLAASTASASATPLSAESTVDSEMGDDDTPASSTHPPSEDEAEDKRPEAEGKPLALQKEKHEQQPQQEQQKQQPIDAVQDIQTRPSALLQAVPVPPQSSLVYLKTEKMSYASSRFWFLMQYLEDPTAFNLTCRLRFTGPIRLGDAEAAIKAIGQRHEAFRTAFFANPDRMNEPTQGVLATSLLHLERRAIAGEDEVERETEELQSHIFEITRGETIRIKLLSLTPTTHFLLFGFHHINIDGFSFNILLGEINKLYDGDRLPEVSCQFSDFAAKQRRDVESGAMQGEIEFWRNMYPDFPETLPLFPLAQTGRRKNLRVYEYELVETELDARIARQIKTQCKRHRITTFHFFLAALKVFLFRHLDVDDLVIGIADANRADSSVAGTVGFLLNLLPIRFHGRDGSDAKFKDAAVDVRDKAYAALANSRVPFDVLLEQLQIPRSTAHSPLFQVFMDYRQLAVDKPRVLGGEADGTASVGKTAYDLVLDVNEANANIKVTFRTQKYLYARSATEKLFDSFMRMVKLFAANMETDVQRVPIWDEQEVLAAKILGRGPPMETQWPATLSHRIREVAGQNSQRMAIKDGVGSAISYAEMQRQVSHIANSLAAAGVKPGLRVAVFQEPTAQWILSMLAIWQVGATYVPLDLRSSLARLATVAKVAKLSAVLCHNETKDNLPQLALPADVTPVNVSSILSGDESDAAGAGTTKARAEADAVILFTSGTTGTPKGIQLRHSALQNTIEGLSRQYGLEREVVLQQSAYTFDFSLDQILVGLANGGTVVVVPKAHRGDAVEIAKTIQREGVTYTRATPSEYTTWITHGNGYLAGRATSWRFAWAGGELMTSAVQRSFESLALPALKLYNSYGPGETITCTKGEIVYGPAVGPGEQENIPVGRPLPNYSVYIVDRSLEPVPVGVSGEIVIGGPSVAKGYLNNTKLTDQKFLGNSYAPEEFAALDGRTVYRTGDMGRLSPEGAVLFEGRISGDTQVKLRGQRVELEEIEAAIMKTAEGVVSRVVASVRSGELLAAHVEIAPSGMADDSKQQEYLRNLRYQLALPPYMIPNLLIPLQSIPLNAHGKVNRKAIAEMALPQASEDDGDIVLSETEQKLKDVWLEVVSSDVAKAVSIRDQTTFFEVGGNSLLLVRLQAMVRQTFRVAVPLIDLFEDSTLGGMAAKIASAEKAEDIDWEAETDLDKDVVHPADVVPVAPRGAEDGVTVLMTGCTGFVGRHLLQKLVQDERVARVHCVAVRPQQRALPMVDSDKIVTYDGDLGEPLLGLEPAVFERLAAEVDFILHSGANRSFFDNYNLLKGSNLTSTRTLVRLAAPKRTPLHFISSGGVLDLTRENRAPPTDGSDGYIATKWASEKHLAKAAEALGIPVSVHRVVPAGEEMTATEEMIVDLMRQMRDIATEMKTLPSQSGWNGSFDLIQVEELAQRITDAGLAAAGATATTVEADLMQTVHHTCEVRVEMNDILPFVESFSEGKDFDSLPAHKWIGKAKLRGLRWHIASMDSAVVGDEDAGEMVAVRR